MTSSRKTLSVIGPHSGCGKTLFVTHLARHVPGLGCLKVRPIHRRSGGGESAPQTVEDGFYMEDSTGLNDPGGDTALYLAAGAAQVEILRHQGDGLKKGLCVALDRFPPDAPIVVESSSAVRFLSPVAVVLIVRPPLREMKPSTDAILDRVTDLVVNASEQGGSASGTAERLRQDYPRLRPPYTWLADLVSEPPPAEMLARVRLLLAAGERGATGSVSD